MTLTTRASMDCSRAAIASAAAPPAVSPIYCSHASVDCCSEKGVPKVGPKDASWPLHSWEYRYKRLKFAQLGRLCTTLHLSHLLVVLHDPAEALWGIIFIGWWCAETSLVQTPEPEIHRVDLESGSIMSIPRAPPRAAPVR